jgi:phenylacetate-CoA ligase
MLSLDRLYWTAFLAANMAGQSRYPFLPLAKIIQDRDKAARRMISHAFNHVPHYHQVLSHQGLAPKDFCGIEDLCRLPVIDAQTVLRNPGYFRATNIKQQDCLSLKTSGSSGLRRAIYLDRASIFRNAAQGERERSMITKVIGKKHRYREAVIVLDPEMAESSTPRVQRFMRQHAFFPRAVEVQRIYIDAAESPSSYLLRLNQFAPDLIHGYGSSIDALMDHVTTKQEEFHRPSAVYFHSDALASRTRASLNSLDVPVFSTYEACEALKIGFECEAHHGYHVNIDTYPICIVDTDGNTVPMGQQGRVVVFNLSNQAMVLLNYDLGDRARWLVEPCPCGRTLPRLELLEGSPIATIQLPCGKTVSPTEIYQLFLGEPALREHQVVHINPRHFRLVLVLDDSAERDACGARIEREFRELFGDDVTAELVFQEQIPLSQGGKKCSFIPLKPC